MPEFNVSVEVPAPVIEVGLNVAVAPDGNPEIERLTVCALPEVIAVEIVDVPELPAVTLTDVGEAEMLKSFAVVLTLTLADPLKPLASVSTTLMVCVPLAFRVTPKVWDPASADVNV